jgi:4-diphosphocytidyl-2-C-methyl-D-erythritol kinase
VSKAGATDLCWLVEHTTNDLEPPARALQPIIGDVLEALKGSPNVLLARMSGSGATCFGLFEDDASASRAAQILSTSYPDWWVRAAKIIQ